MDARVVSLVGSQGQGLFSPASLGDLNPCSAFCACALIDDDQAGDGPRVRSGEQRCTLLAVDAAATRETGRLRPTGRWEGRESSAEPRQEVSDQIWQPEPVPVAIPAVVEM